MTGATEKEEKQFAAHDCTPEKNAEKNVFKTLDMLL
jgi:hypothetical protein